MLTVLYFAAVRDLVGLERESLPAGPGTDTIAAVRETLARLHPELSGKLGKVRFARNERFAPDETAVGDGDVIALIPPVAGG